MPVETLLENEYVPPCWVCGRLWKRKEVDYWYYFNEMVVCREHSGAEEWYSGAVLLADARMEHGNEK